MVAILLSLVLVTAVAADPAGSVDLERAARDYRIQVYDTFRLDRAEFDRRNAEWRRKREAWKAEGAKPEDEARLIEWLLAATGALRAGRSGPLPAVPLVGAEVAVPRTDPSERTLESVVIPQGTEARSPRVVDPTLPPVLTELRKEPHETVAVDIEELAARCRGYNRSLRSLEAELSPSSQRPTANELTQQVKELAVLVRRRQGLSLYFEHLVPDAEERGVPGLSSPQSAISLLAERIFAARTHLSGSNYRGSETQRRRELEKLEQLSQRLGELGIGGN